VSSFMMRRKHAADALFCKQ